MPNTSIEPATLQSLARRSNQLSSAAALKIRSCLLNNNTKLNFVLESLKL